MPNHDHLIKNATLTRYTRAAASIKAAAAKLDTELRRLERDRSLFDGERDRRKVEARQTAEASIREHRREMSEALADHRSWSTTHTDSPPSGEEAQRRAYYSVRAQAELANLSAPDALALVQRMAATGDTERGQEYAAAARGRVPAGALRAVERQVESVDAAGARHWGAAVDAIEGQLAWFDRHVATLMERAGFISPEAKAGTAPETGLDTRILDLWSQGLDGHAGAAFAASKEADGQWDGVAAAIGNGYGGGDGWDSTGDDHSAQQPTGDPQAQPDAPADAHADQADAGADA